MNLHEQSQRFNHSNHLKKSNSQRPSVDLNLYNIISISVSHNVLPSCLCNLRLLGPGPANRGQQQGPPCLRHDPSSLFVSCGHLLAKLHQLGDLASARKGYLGHYCQLFVKPHACPICND